MIKRYSIVFLLFICFAIGFNPSVKAVTTYTVTSTADNGAGTLRSIITSSVAAGDIVEFGLGGASTITLTSGAITISTHSITIDGFSEPGASVNTTTLTSGAALNPTYMITITTSTVSAPQSAIVLSGNYITIKGLIIKDVGDGTSSANDDIAIDISGDYNHVEGCYLGSDGTNQATSTAVGIRINTGANNNTIGDGTAAGVNLISGLLGGQHGILIQGATTTGNVIKGNMIGLKADGATEFSSANQKGITIGVSANNNTIGGTGPEDGNIISANNINGILINGAAYSNTIMGNIIGPQSDGSTFVTGTAQNNGIQIAAGAYSNIIGGSSAAERNIISGNGLRGIWVQGAASTGNIIKGNYIGVAADGISLLSGADTQDKGIELQSDAPAVTIGGINSGEGNVISAQDGTAGSIYGIYVGNTAGGNEIYGNIIGAKATGTTSLASDQDYGIFITSSPDNVIGGTSEGHRNTISDNEIAGIYITGSGSTGTIIKGNYIGVASDGVTNITSNTQLYGIDLETDAPATTIGGTESNEGNVISGNGTNGIFIENTAGGNAIYGNIIGAKKTGTTSIASSQDYGINISSSPDNIIGGTSSGHTNTVSDNETAGIYITGATSTGTIIKGNYIGTASDGATSINSSTQLYGISLDATSPATTIGGTEANEGNIISGNSTYGIYLNTTSGHTILGNHIGTYVGATASISGSQTKGIYINGSPDNTIGGNSSGARNIISDNTIQGIGIVGASSTGNAIKGNYIGLADDGITFLSGSNQQNGIVIDYQSPFNIIGGTGANEGNVISGNTMRGISLGSLFFSGSMETEIYGNIIGPQADGNSYVFSNSQNYGIQIWNTADNIIGSATGIKQVISGNEIVGLEISYAGSTGNIVKGNYIGLASNGTSIITNAKQEWGIHIDADAEANTIGGTAAGEANVISGNYDGTVISRGLLLQQASSNEIIGNIIGPQANGTTFLASSQQARGIEIEDSPDLTISNNTISGNEDDAVAGSSYGIYIWHSGSTGCSIKSNYIGPGNAGASLTGADGQEYGVYLTNGGVSSPTSNTIGGKEGAAGANPNGNVIAYNTLDGVYITSAGATKNLIARNLIYSNGNKAINLNGSGNGGKAAPAITSLTSTSVGGTGASTTGAGDTVEVYKNTSDVAQDALIYLGSTKADNSGNWTLSGITIDNGETATAIARTILGGGTNNTSEFSTSIMTPLPIELLSFNATAVENSYVKLDWVTASEINNDYFTIEKTKDGINFETVATMNGAGTSSQTLYYTLDDNKPYEGTSYYRLKQTDYDGQFDYSDLTPVYFSKSKSNVFDFSIFPNPSGEKENINLSVVGEKNQEVLIVIRDVFGKEYYSKIFILEDNNFAISISKDFDLAPGIYTIIASSKDSLVSSKLVVQ